MRAAYLFTILLLLTAFYFTYRWGLVQQEKVDLLIKQNQLRVELYNQVVRYEGLLQNLADSCQSTLFDVSLRLGLLPYQKSFNTMYVVNQSKVFDGTGGRDGKGKVPNKIKYVGKK